MTRGYVVSAFNRTAIIIRLPPEARAEEHRRRGDLADELFRTIVQRAALKE